MARNSAEEKHEMSGRSNQEGFPGGVSVLSESLQVRFLYQESVLGKGGKEFGAQEECMKVQRQKKIFKGQQCSQSYIGVSSPAELCPSAHLRQRNCKLIQLIYAEITSAGEASCLYCPCSSDSQAHYSHGFILP